MFVIPRDLEIWDVNLQSWWRHRFYRSTSLKKYWYGQRHKVQGRRILSEFAVSTLVSPWLLEKSVLFNEQHGPYWKLCPKQTMLYLWQNGPPKKRVSNFARKSRHGQRDWKTNDYHNFICQADGNSSISPVVSNLRKGVCFDPTRCPSLECGGGRYYLFSGTYCPNTIWSKAIEEGTIYLAGDIARVLFDPWATHSFVSIIFAL